MKTTRHCFISRFKNVATCLLLASSLTAARAELFEIKADTNDDDPFKPHLSETVGEKNLVDLVKAAINAANGFDEFQGRGFDASLKYAGKTDAITFSINSSGTKATLKIPSTGFEKFFEGATRSDVEDAIVDFLKKDGSAELSKFQQAMAKESLVAVTDGNPTASTATFSAQTFNQYAFAPGETRAQKEGAKPTSGAGFSFYGDIGTFDANGIKGTAYTLPLSMKVNLTERVGLGIDLPLSYIDIEGASIFGGGLVLGLPVKVVARDADQRWLWQVTPSGGGLVSASYDMLAGGLESMIGASSLLSYDFEHFTLTMGNGLFWFEGIPLTIGGVEFDPGVSQQVLKNGLKVSVPMGQNWIVEGYGIHTKFLEDAAVDQYYTVGGEVGWKPHPEKKRYWMLGAYSEIGDNFTAVHASFGSTWKF